MSRYSGENTLLQIFANVKEKCDSLSDKIKGKQDNLAWDSIPTQGSQNPVTSDGVYTALQNIGGNGGGEDEVVWMTANINLANLQLSEISHSYAEIVALINEGKFIKFRFNFGAGFCFSELALYDSSRDEVYFQIMMRANMGYGLALYYLNLVISDSSCNIYPYMVETVDIGS